MRWLLFLSRVALVCNLFFLIAFSLQLYDWIKNDDLGSTIIIVGFVLSALFNPAVNLCYLVLFWVKRKSLAIVPAWLLVLNILFLILQIIYLLMLNADSKSYA
jgi:hypothetical protein